MIKYAGLILLLVSFVTWANSDKKATWEQLGNSQIESDSEHGDAPILNAVEVPQGLHADSDEFKGNPAVDWLVHAKLSEPLRVEDLLGVFNSVWQDQFVSAVSLYGVDAKTSQWNYLNDLNASNRVTELQIAWSFSSVNFYADELPQASDFEYFFAAVKQAFKQLGPVELSVELSPKEVADKAKKLYETTYIYDQTAVIKLDSKSGDGFTGMDVKDVMIHLGLESGDVGLYQWQNRSGFGDDFYFYVFSPSQPGYYEAKHIEKDHVRLNDLSFGFSVGRSVDPVVVFQRMLLAAEYAQKKLGGDISITLNGETTISSEQAKQDIRVIANELKSRGLQAGSHAALMQFGYN